jgi:protein TonB
MKTITMETKSKHNLEQTKVANFFTGFCIVSGLTLAVFSYGNYEAIKIKEKDVKLSNDFNLLDTKDKPLEINTKVQPVVNQTQSVNPPSDLENIKPVDNETQESVEKKPLLDGIKGDTTQIVNTQIVEVSNPVVEFPDVEPDFPGGYSNWINWLSDNFVYPDLDLEMGNQGVVYLQFVVEKDGSITDVEVIKGVSSGIDREAKRLLKKSPKWTPGEVSGQQVRTRLRLPINFVIN